MQLDLGDLARLTVGPPLDPVDESLFSVEVLRARRPSPLTAAWTRSVRARLDAGMLRSLTTVATDRGAPPGSGVLCGAVLHRPGWRGAPALLQRYREVALDPYWPAIVALLEADRARRGRIMARQGVGPMLATLHPRVRWRPPFLDVDGPGPDPVVAGGAPVTLVPSVFCLDRPRVVTGASGPGRQGAVRLVVYPALRSVEDAASLWTWRAPLAGRALAALLGRTRARALEAIAGTCSTTELARRIGVSPATASHHAAALRGGRLVVSRRDGSEIRHRLTALGAALLDPSATALPCTASPHPRPELSTAG